MASHACHRSSVPKSPSMPESGTLEAVNRLLILPAIAKGCRGRSAAYARARPAMKCDSAPANTAAFDKRAWLREQSRRVARRPRGERAKAGRGEGGVGAGRGKQNQFKPPDTLD